MSASWYDPISERWRKMPEPVKPIHAQAVPEGIYERASRLLRESKLWKAIEATATATQMSQPCPDGSG